MYSGIQAWLFQQSPVLCFLYEPGGGAGELPEQGLPTGGQDT